VFFGGELHGSLQPPSLLKLIPPPRDLVSDEFKVDHKGLFVTIDLAVRR
jgi:hypothetical protein